MLKKYLLNGNEEADCKELMGEKAEASFASASSSPLPISVEGDMLGEPVAPVDTDQVTHVLLGTKRAGKHDLEQGWPEIYMSPARGGRERERVWVRGESSFESWGTGAVYGLWGLWGRGCACPP